MANRRPLIINSSAEQIQELTDSDSLIGNGTIPVGGIIMWSGTIASIPSGWALCNGSNSTPDLRNTFVIGAHSDSSGAKTTVTGSATQSGGDKDAVLPAHSHVHNNVITEEGSEFSIGPGSRSASSTNDATEITGIDASGSASTTQTGTNANLPPYFALAYIMRTV